MKSLIASSVALLAIMNSAVLAGSPSEALRRLENRATTCTEDAVDSLLFTVSLATFGEARETKNPSECNWASDGCSWSPGRPVGFDFIPSCHRHDFGYRNMKAQKRFTAEMKARVDANFKNDLYNYCADFAGAKGARCRRIANVYYASVRRFGKRDTEEAVEENVSISDIELDADIEGQKIPSIPTDGGIDVDDLESFLSGGKV